MYVHDCRVLKMYAERKIMTEKDTTGWLKLRQRGFHRRKCSFGFVVKQPRFFFLLLVTRLFSLIHAKHSSFFGLKMLIQYGSFEKHFSSKDNYNDCFLGLTKLIKYSFENALPWLYFALRSYLNLHESVPYQSFCCFSLSCSHCIILGVPCELKM